MRHHHCRPGRTVGWEAGFCYLIKNVAYSTLRIWENASRYSHFQIADCKLIWTDDPNQFCLFKSLLLTKTYISHGLLNAFS